jgi:hypothetical protein
MMMMMMLVMVMMMMMMMMMITQLPKATPCGAGDERLATEGAFKNHTDDDDNDDDDDDDDDDDNDAPARSDCLWGGR